MVTCAGCSVAVNEYCVTALGRLICVKLIGTEMNDKKSVVDRLRELLRIIGNLWAWAWNYRAQIIIAFVGGALVIAFVGVIFLECVAHAFQEWLGTDNKKETLEFLGWIGGFAGLCGLLILRRRVAQALEKIKESAYKLREFLRKKWESLCERIGTLWAWVLLIAIGVLIIAIANRMMIAPDIINIPLNFGVDATIYILLTLVIFLSCKNNLDEDSAQPIIAAFGLIMLVAFIGVMLSDSISSVLQEGFGIEKITVDNLNSKNAVLKFISLGIGGIIAVYGLIALNKRAIAQIEQNKLQIEQNKLTKIGLSQERFKAAVEHLSNIESESGRIASFYEFYYLAKNAKSNKDDSAQTSAQTILDILCAHLRLTADTKKDVTADNKNPASPSITDDKNIKDGKNPKRPKEEINSLIGVLFSREAEDVFGGLNYDLQHVNLTEVDFRKIHNPKANVNFSDAILNNAIFDNINLSGFNFQKATLHKTRFWGANLQKADLFEADLFEADLYGAQLLGAKLSGAKLSGANFPSMKLSEANLSGANLSGANLSGAKLLGTNLSKANLSKANLSKANLFIANLSEANLSDADLSKANLSKANLSKANLSKAILSKAILSKAILPSADLLKANLSDADLSGADLRWTNLSGTDLRRTNLSSADLRWTNLSDADLSGAELLGAELAGAELHKANLSGANLFIANLSGANLSSADLLGAELAGAKLSEANLSKTNLSKTNLCGADLHKAKCLELAILSEAKYNDRTIFPDGFSRPEDMVEVERQDRGLSEDDSR